MRSGGSVTGQAACSPDSTGILMSRHRCVIPYGSADRSIAFISLRTAELVEKFS
jgi:hypothetical protein